MTFVSHTGLYFYNYGICSGPDDTARITGISCGLRRSKVPVTVSPVLNRFNNTFNAYSPRVS